MVILLNISIALIFLYLGGLLVAWGVAIFILESSEAEILAKIRELKDMTKEY